MKYNKSAVVGMCMVLLFCDGYAMQLRPSQQPGEPTIEGLKKRLARLRAATPPVSIFPLSTTESKESLCEILRDRAFQLEEVEKNRAELEVQDFYRKDIVALLSQPYLSDRYPNRRNKIKVVLDQLQKFPIHGHVLGEAIEEICQNKRNVVERAWKFQNSSLPNGIKQLELQKLRRELEANKPRGFGLLYLLWQQDFQELKKIENISRPVTPGLIPDPLKEFFKEVAQTADPVALLQGRFIQMLHNMQAGVKSGSDYNNYFKKMIEYILRLKESNADPKVVEQYEKMLDAEAIIVLTESITSQPEEQPINYFRGIESLKSYEKLRDQVNAVNKNMYNPAQLHNNVKVLSEVRDKVLKKYNDINSKDLALEKLILHSLSGKIGLLIYLLQMEKHLQQQEGPQNADYVWALILDDLRGLARYIGQADIYGNDTDINQIEQVGRNSVFIDFITNKINAFDEDDQKIIVQACEMINEKIPSFPVLVRRKPAEKRSPRPLVEKFTGPVDVVLGQGLDWLGDILRMEVITPQPVPLWQPAAPAVPQQPPAPQQGVAQQAQGQVVVAAPPAPPQPAAPVVAAPQQPGQGGGIFMAWWNNAKDVWDRATNIFVWVLRKIFG